MYDFRDMAGPGIAGQPGAAGIPEFDIAQDDGINSVPTDSPVDSSTTNVRSNFPETWIWTEEMTGCVTTTIFLLCNIFFSL